MRKLRNLLLSLLSLLGLLASYAWATEPCPPHPCRDGLNQFQESACAAAADWVAVGEISEVKRDRQGFPLNKDFASFTFLPEIWEKGKSRSSDGLRYKVGWCHNQSEVPADYSGKFRMYGLHQPTLNGKSQFLDFIEVE